MIAGESGQRHIGVDNEFGQQLVTSSVNVFEFEQKFLRRNPDSMELEWASDPPNPDEAAGYKEHFEFLEAAFNQLPPGTGITLTDTEIGLLAAYTTCMHNFTHSS